MKERPILFSGPMVRAILDGRKTQTRRVVKPQPIMRDGGDCVIEYRGQKHGGPASYLIGEILPRFGCPYGQPGDRLWVRETWCCAHSTEDKPSPNDLVHYRADKSEAGDVITKVSSWSPSIHMPRAYSRITLEVTGVRVERLNEIADKDAMAEGVAQDVENIPAPFADPVYYWRNYDRGRKIDMCADARTSFVTLWESINGAGSWSANPWVWVVEFRRMDK